MKLASFRGPGEVSGERLGLLNTAETHIQDVGATMLDFIQGAALDLERLQQTPTQSPAWLPLKEVRLLAPLSRPGKIVAIGLNYRDHAEEQNAQLPSQPLVFAKFSTAVMSPENDIVLPRASQFVDHEVELGVVIGKRARHVTAEQARDYVLGYTVLNDVTARDLQKSDRQWVRSKSFDTFCPMGPYLALASDWEFPPRRDIRLWVNGELRQQSNTANMIFDVGALIAFLSQAFTLEPGDVIATGTPAGVGVFRKPPIALQPGDVVEAEIEGIGRLRNPVVAEFFQENLVS